MLKLKVTDLREGLIFSKPLYTEESELVIHGGLPIKKTDISVLLQKGVALVYSFGKIVKNSKPFFSEEDSVISKLKNQLKEKVENTKEKIIESQNVIDSVAPKAQPAVPVASASTTKSHYEFKIARLELIESVIENFTINISSFIKNPLDSMKLKENLVDISETVIAETERDRYVLLDICSFIDNGNTHILHALRVALFSAYLAFCMELPKKRILNVIVGALLHDIGNLTYFRINEKENINMSKEMVNLPVTHPIYGYKTAKEILSLHDEICQIVLHHHEQPDGKGFPRRVDDSKLSISDKIVYSANLFVNLIQNNNVSGYATALKQLTYLFETYPSKFDAVLIQKIFDLSKSNSYYLHLSKELE